MLIGISGASAEDYNWGGVRLLGCEGEFFRLSSSLKYLLVEIFEANNEDCVV